ncbi:hypothetical protein [Thalassotalea fusca]
MEQLVKILDQIGQSAAIANGIFVNNASVINKTLSAEKKLDVSLAEIKAMIDKTDGDQDIVCFIFGPGKEHEVPKEGNKPPKEDEPFDNEEKDNLDAIA